MGTRRRERPPAPGAARFYKLVPVRVEDAFAYVEARLRHRGYKVFDTGWWMQPTLNGDYTMVCVWAIAEGG